MAFPSPGGSETLEAQVLGTAVARTHPLIRMADAGHCSDCCRRRWLGPRARPRITQGLGKEGLLPHTPEAGVLPASHTGLPKRPPCPAARPHAGLLLYPWASLSLGAAGRATRGIWGRGVGWGLEALLDLGPMLLLLLVGTGRRPLGAFTSAKPGRIGFPGDAAMKPFAGRLALRTAVSLPGYLWRSPDSGFVLRFGVGQQRALTSQSLNQPCMLTNRS